MKRDKKHKYMSDTIEGGEELIPTVIIQFHDYMDLWMTLDEYNALSKFSGVMKFMNLSFKSVIRVHKLLKHPSSYPATEWVP
jgi:hypothetical protein